MVNVEVNLFTKSLAIVSFYLSLNKVIYFIQQTEISFSVAVHSSQAVFFYIRMNENEFFL